MQETTILSLSYGQIVIKPVEQHHGLVPASFETYQVIEPGDIIIRPTDLQNDWTSLRFGLSRHHGAITSAYMCFHTRGIISREYGHLLLHTYDLKKIFYGLGSGLRQNLNWRDFQYLPCLVPPLPEQNAIVRYLKHATEHIRSHINAKEQLINLLEEQRQVVIHRAVTRGLDPNVRLNPSGVEWLGDVPAHWEVIALRYLATKFGSGVTPRGGATIYQNTGIPFLRSQNVYFDGLRLEDVARITPRLHQTLSNTHVKSDDVLLNITGASIGRVCSVPSDFGEGNVSQHVCIIRPKKNRLLSGFLASYLSTTFMQREIHFEQNGASREGLTLDSIRNFKIVLPDISEQQRILTETWAQTEQLIAAVSATQRQIEFLQEYRTRLIADVVTGKLDVREAAFKLPEAHDELSIADKPELQSG